MALTPGTRLGVYEVTAQIGAGGMGEVYKARDTRLDRTVAIKILPEALAADPQFRDRFDREARTISQLDHPHICALYDVGEQTPSTPSTGSGQAGSGQAVRYLVMPYLPGETLADRLTKGALPFDQALQIALQVADALATAHKAGIVHRDLKPANIMLTKSGAGSTSSPQAMLLDFGLAKAMGPSEGDGFSRRQAEAEASAIQITTPAMTQAGMILGTAAYMSPEQARGRAVDKRTDIWAFGCVLYEMLSGHTAFSAHVPGLIPPPFRR